MLNMNWILLLCPNAWCILARLLALIYAAHFTFHILAACLPFPRIYCSPHLYVCVKRPANSTKFTCSRVEIHCSMIEYIQFYYAFFFSSVSSMCSNHFNIILFLPALFFIHFICLDSHRILCILHGTIWVYFCIEPCAICVSVGRFAGCSDYRARHTKAMGLCLMRGMCGLVGVFYLWHSICGCQCNCDEDAELVNNAI